jgi:hypothetical protein
MGFLTRSILEALSRIKTLDSERIMMIERKRKEAGFEDEETDRDVQADRSVVCHSGEPSLASLISVIFAVR